jgi:hypothetical protein
VIYAALGDDVSEVTCGSRFRYRVGLVNLSARDVVVTVSLGRPTRPGGPSNDDTAELWIELPRGVRAVGPATSEPTVLKAFAASSDPIEFVLELASVPVTRRTLTAELKTLREPTGLVVTGDLVEPTVVEPCR